jgi:hypothetical protein
MRLRYVVTLMIGCVLLIGPATALAGKRHSTRLTLDSSVPVGNGYWLDSGRMITSGSSCIERAVRVIGVRSDGKRKLLDWDLISLPGHAWATKSPSAGFVRVVATVRRTKHCRGDRIQIFPLPAPGP